MRKRSFINTKFENENHLFSMINCRLFCAVALKEASAIFIPNKNTSSYVINYMRLGIL